MAAKKRTLIIDGETWYYWVGSINTKLRHLNSSHVIPHELILGLKGARLQEYLQGGLNIPITPGVVKEYITENLQRYQGR